MEKEFERILKDEERIVAGESERSGCLWDIVCTALFVVALCYSYLAVSRPNLATLPLAVIFWLAFIWLRGYLLAEQKRTQQKLNLQIVKAIAEIRKRLDRGETAEGQGEEAY